MKLFLLKMNNVTRIHFKVALNHVLEFDKYSLDFQTYINTILCIGTVVGSRLVAELSSSTCKCNIMRILIFCLRLQGKLTFGKIIELILETRMKDIHM